MLRETRMRNSPDVVDGSRMRGGEVTRLESFADAGLSCFRRLLRFVGDPLEHPLQI